MPVLHRKIGEKPNKNDQILFKKVNRLKSSIRTPVTEAQLDSVADIVAVVWIYAHQLP